MAKPKKRRAKRTGVHGLKKGAHCAPGETRGRPARCRRFIVPGGSVSGLGRRKGRKGSKRKTGKGKKR